MAVYRERRRPRVWLLALIGAVALIIGVLIITLLGLNQPAPAGETPRGRAHAALTDMSEALDLFTIEYPKAQAGQPSGAGPALTRARNAFDKAQPDLAAVDPQAAVKFNTALQAVEQQAAAQAPAATVVPAATQLRSDVRAWVQQP